MINVPRFSRVGGQTGFTLIELVMALVITGFVTTILYQLIQGQGRFVLMQSSREEVQQNSRASVELISSELRAVSRTDPGLIQGDADLIAFRSARIWGVYCDAGAGHVYVRFPTIAGVSLGTSGASGLLIRDADPNGARWQVDPAGLNTNPGQQAAADAACTTRLGEPGVSRAYSGTLNPIGTPPSPGAPVYLYERVTYQVLPRTDGGVTRNWLFRTDGASTPQPMAGPLDTDGLRFRYFAAGAEIAPPGTSAAQLTQISRVHIRVAAASRRASSNQTQVDSIAVRFRN